MEVNFSFNSFIYIIAIVLIIIGIFFCYIKYESNISFFKNENMTKKKEKNAEEDKKQFVIDDDFLKENEEIDTIKELITAYKKDIDAEITTLKEDNKEINTKITNINDHLTEFEKIQLIFNKEISKQIKTNLDEKIDLKE